MVMRPESFSPFPVVTGTPPRDLERPLGPPEEGLSTQQPVVAKKEDPYELNVKIRDNHTAAMQQIPSWPYTCDSDACGGTGTYSTSCNGTCHSDCR